jgi:hypothetical protein
MGIGLNAEVRDVTLELIQSFSEADLIEQQIKVSGLVLNKEDKPLTTEERKQLHERRFY